MQKMNELPERLNHERGHVIYEPEMGDMEFGIAKATDESNWPVTAEMVRRYNMHPSLLQLAHELSLFIAAAGHAETGPGFVSLTISPDLVTRTRALLNETKEMRNG